MRKFKNVIKKIAVLGVICGMMAGSMLGNSTDAQAGVPTEVSTVNRVYNPKSGEHLYTIDENEVNVLCNSGWRNETIEGVYNELSWTVYNEANFANFYSGSVAVSRLWNKKTGEHLYTSDQGEIKNLVNSKYGWVNEGVIFWTSTQAEIDGSGKVHRLYNKAKGHHLYTLDQSEVNNLVSNYGWVEEYCPYYNSGF